MDESRRVQVTLDARGYAAVARRARREGKKLAAVVREAVEQHCVVPEARRRRREAIEKLLSVEGLPAPRSLPEWEREYSRLKVGAATGCPDDGEGAGAEGQEG